jgi:hypothetical protein
MTQRYYRNGQPVPPGRTPGGRPETKERMLAILNGDRTYLGKYCKKCGARERYTKGGACIACQRLHSVAARAALKAIGRDGFVEHVIAADTQIGEEAPQLGYADLPTRYFWHPESGKLFTTTTPEDPDGDGLLEEVDAAKYLTLQQEACYLGSGHCPSVEDCKAAGCQGDPSLKINHSTESPIDPQPEPWD